MKADICFFLEGTYPYVSGGVSAWTHNFILAHPDSTFAIVCLIPEGFTGEYKFQIPENVVSIQNVVIGSLPEVPNRLTPDQETALFQKIEIPLLNILHHGNLDDLRKIIDSFKSVEAPLGNESLLLSESAWRLLIRMYSTSLGQSCFLDYFWSWRSLIGGLYSMLLAPLPQATIYHALCTGYAGLFLARAHLERGKPCLITEHGIYTNERRIEIASADWLYEATSLNLNIEQERHQRGLKELWIDTFCSYSRICYEACEKIVTLHAGNQPLQLLDGADRDKMILIPNGIDLKVYGSIEKKSGHPPTVALIGRVVPIKDIKTYIRAIGILKVHVPNLIAYIIGPTEEDTTYTQECLDLVNYLGLGDTIEFTGLADVKEYFPIIDVVVLTSISESQPLILLEAGACGIPSVATNVGSCFEIVYGRKDEEPPLGVGGLIAPLANPQEVANQIERLLLDPPFYEKCSAAIKKRVFQYYGKEQQTKAYDDLYKSLRVKE